MHPSISAASSASASSSTRALRLERYQIALTLLDDFTHITSLSDLYAERHPDILRQLKHAKQQAAQHCAKGVTAEGRLSYAAMMATFKAGNADEQEAWLSSINQAINTTIRVSRDYSQPHHEKNLTEHSIDTLRSQIIRHQTNQDPTWLSCMMAATDNTRLDRLEYQDAVSGHAYTSPRSKALLKGCADLLDGLDKTGHAVSPFTLAHAQQTYDDLYESLGFHAERFYWEQARKAQHDGSIETITTIKESPTCPASAIDANENALPTRTPIVHAIIHGSVDMNTVKCIEIAATYVADNDESPLFDNVATLSLMLLSMTQGIDDPRISQGHAALAKSLSLHEPIRYTAWRAGRVTRASKTPDLHSHLANAPSMQ
jgi:hypothetical protein